jgi:hypothetical protein
MKPNMRRNFPGTFLPRDLGRGAWRLSRVNPGRGGSSPDDQALVGPGSVDVYLRGADLHAADILRSTGFGDLDIEWRGDTVVLTPTSAGQRGFIGAQSAIVHEPLGGLYQGLPLASLDEKARRFWRRVFWLVRIPGGRHLLGVLARRSRSGG